MRYGCQTRNQPRMSLPDGITPLVHGRLGELWHRRSRTAGCGAKRVHFRDGSLSPVSRLDHRRSRKAGCWRPGSAARRRRTPTSASGFRARRAIAGACPGRSPTGSSRRRKRYPCWNPVLFQPKDGPLMLFYKVGPSPDNWWGMLMTSGGRRRHVVAPAAPAGRHPGPHQEQAGTAFKW